MSIPNETRTSVKRWKKILQLTYDELVKLGANDVWVFGSQAMSLHMKKRALASKDLDLLATGVSIRMIEQLCNALGKYSDGRPPNYEYQVSTYENRRYPVFSISLVARNERPFVIELFQTFLGYEVTRLTRYSTFVNRWKNQFQTLTIGGIVATRLAFRPPDRISSFNAHRLNGFIESVQDKFEWKDVEAFAKDFQLEGTINDNLRDLRRRKLRIIGSENLTFLSQKSGLKNQ